MTNRDPCEVIHRVHRRPLNDGRANVICLPILYHRFLHWGQITNWYFLNYFSLKNQNSDYESFFVLKWVKGRHNQIYGEYISETETKHVIFYISISRTHSWLQPAPFPIVNYFLNTETTFFVPLCYRYVLHIWFHKKNSNDTNTQSVDRNNKSEAHQAKKSNKKQIKQKQRNHRHTMVEANGLPVNINQTLPAEILRQIFHLLSPADLKAVVLVCRLI